MSISTTNRYAPCFRCKSRLNSSNNSSNKKIKEFKNILNTIKRNHSFSVIVHGQEKALLKNIDFSKREERILATSGEIIEIQQGKKRGEFKIIFFNYRNDEPMHYIFLYNPRMALPGLVNVYNPTEGKTFKWSRDGKKRLYLNAFRSCCPHPNDNLK